MHGHSRRSIWLPAVLVVIVAMGRSRRDRTHGSSQQTLVQCLLPLLLNTYSSERRSHEGSERGIRRTRSRSGSSRSSSSSFISPPRKKRKKTNAEHKAETYEVRKLTRNETILVKLPRARLADMLEAASKYVSVTHTAAWCLTALLAGIWLLTRMKPDFRTCHLKVQTFQELRNRVQERVYAVTRSRGVSYVSDLISKLSDVDVTSIEVISVATHEGFQIKWTEGASSTHQGGKPRVGKKAVAPDTASTFPPKLMTGTKRKQDQEKEGADVKKRKQDQVPEVTAAWRIHRAHEGVIRLREADTAVEAARHAGDHSQRNRERLPRAARLQDAAAAGICTGQAILWSTLTYLTCRDTELATVRTSWYCEFHCQRL